MVKIINYLELPNDAKDTILQQLFHVGFCPAYGNQKTMKKEMDKTRKGALPQYLFVLRDDKLIGYMFLIAEQENYCKAFPWWAVDNSDELPLETSIQLLEYGIQLSSKCSCPKLADRLKIQLESQKKGFGRRPENLCR